MAKKFLTALTAALCVAGAECKTDESVAPTSNNDDNMKILFINGSPNKEGNTAHLAAKLLEGHNYETLNLCDYRINFYGQTTTGDQLYEIVARMEEADIVVIGSPVYWHNICASVRTLMERFYGHIDDGHFGGRKFFFVYQGAAPTKMMIDDGEYSMKRFAEMYGFSYEGMATNNDEAVKLSAKLPKPSKQIDNWDKTFPKSKLVEHSKVSFVNRFGITLVADFYKPVNATGRLAAIAVSGPFGAVKEQASGLYAQHLAEQGFATIAFDPSFTGESSGEPRYTSSMDINTEDFCAAVDYLSNRDDIDPERIGILGICGWGGIALNAAALDPRIKATASVTLYNLTRVTQRGYFDSMDETARHELKQRLARQRTDEYRTEEIAPQGGLPDTAPADAPDFLKQYIAYYKSPERGYHKRSLNSNMGWNITSQLMRLNENLWGSADEIRTPVLIVHGENAHSRYFGEEAYDKITSGKYADNKRMLIVPGATHCDLYDGGNGNFIPWAEITDFFNSNI